MQHDVRLRATARVIYDTCYPGEEWAPVSFEAAEHHGTIHYRQAVAAARLAQQTLSDPRDAQLALI